MKHQRKKNKPNFPSFSFIDLFAGIGGFRLALEGLGGSCVFSSEIDKYAALTYEKNFGENPLSDITQIKADDISNHDILCAGFPCQAFSIAGEKKGFLDTRGTLFFDVARIIKEKQPKAFLLENVKGLKSHKKGETLKIILNILRNELNYFVPDPETLNAKDFGLAQNRGRIFIVGFHPSSKIKDFVYPKGENNKKVFADVKEESVVSAKYYLSTQYLKTLRSHKERHKNKGNGFGFEIIEDHQKANALVVGGMGRERNLVFDHRLKDFKSVRKLKSEINKEGIRRMTPREWARLQGFPDEFVIPVSNMQAYKQFGNSVAIPVVDAMTQKILEKIFNEKSHKINEKNEKLVKIKQ